MTDPCEQTEMLGYHIDLALQDLQSHHFQKGEGDELSAQKLLESVEKNLRAARALICTSS